MARLQLYYNVAFLLFLPVTFHNQLLRKRRNIAFFFLIPECLFECIWLLENMFIDLYLLGFNGLKAEIKRRTIE